MEDLFEQVVLEDTDDGAIFQANQEGAQSRWLKWRDALFLVFYQYYEDTWESESPSGSIIMLFTSFAPKIFILFQLLGLLLLVQANRTDWANQMWFLRLFAFTRFDQIAAQYNIAYIYFIWSSAIVGSATLTLIFMVFRAYYQLSPNRFFAKNVFGWLLTYLRGIGLVPTSSIFLAVIKHSFFTLDQANEYLDSPCSDFDLGWVGATVAFPAFAASTSVLLHVMLVYEQYQVNSKRNPRAKAHARVDLIVHLVLYVLVIILFTAGDSKK